MSCSYHTHTAMDTTTLRCQQLGTQPPTAATLLAARELAACGCFVRAAFLRGLAQQATSQPPLELVQTLDSLCHEAGLFAPAQLLHDLLPSPQQAADLIYQAACSQAVCGALIHSSSWGEVCATTTSSDSALQRVLRLLQSLLVCSFDAAATAADPAACDTALQQYVVAVLQHLQEAAATHEVLAVCLLHAAASCGVLCDEAAVASWANKQLSQQLQCRLQPLAPAAAADSSSSFLSPQPATPHSSTTSLPETSWPSLALQPLCWTLLLPALLQCMPAQGVLELLQAHLSTAAGSVKGLAQMCDIVAALEASDCSVQAAGMVSQSLAASLAAADTRGVLSALLLAGHLLGRGAWGKGQYLAMLQQAGTALQEGHAGTALPVLLKAFNVLLPTADSAVLQAQLDFLWQLQPHLGPVLQGEVSKATAILRDVLAAQQQLVRQEQQGKQGGKAVGRAALDEYNRLLDQYMQLPRSAAAGGGCLTQVLLARWKLMGAAPAFCDAFTQQPPESVGRARACCAYLQELQAARLCKPEQVEAFKASCLVFGLDLSAQQQEQQQQQRSGAAADPVAALKGLLDRLPVVVSAASRPGLAALLGRIMDHLKRILQPQPAQQQQQGHHQQQQRHAPAWLAAAGEPAAKKQRTAAAAAAGPDTPAEVLDALLSAYAAASGSPPAATDGSWDWRVEFLGVLQELPLLHAPLLQRLLGSLCGSAWPPEVSPQQALWHGSLLAWLSASKLQQVPVLAAAGAAPTDAGVTAAPMAAPLFTWQCSSSSSSHATGNDPVHSRGRDPQGQQPAGLLRGCELVQLLASCTSLASAHERCCAASFWAGYLGCVKTHMTQWSAGPHVGPFGSRSTANASPGVLTALTQPQQDTGAQQQQQQRQHLVAYVPPKLAVLLRQLAAELAGDVQAAAAGAAAAAAVHGAVMSGAGGGAVSYDVAASALQVCTRALKVQAVKWVCQLYRV